MELVHFGGKSSFRQWQPSSVNLHDSRIICRQSTANHWSFRKAQHNDSTENSWRNLVHVQFYGVDFFDQHLLFSKYQTVFLRLVDPMIWREHFPSE